LSDATLPTNQPANVVFTAPNGPLIATGELQIDTGAEVVSQPRASLCRCGASAKKPFCDGSHRMIGFVEPGEAAPEESIAAITAEGPISFSMIPGGPLIAAGPLTLQNAAKVTIATTTETALCRCGASANKPYCDGSHNTIGFEG
jgi:CDGSH-type Zn-finger protein